MNATELNIFYSYSVIYLFSIFHGIYEATGPKDEKEIQFGLSMDFESGKPKVDMNDEAKSIFNSWSFLITVLNMIWITLGFLFTDQWEIFLILLCLKIVLSLLMVFVIRPKKISMIITFSEFLIEIGALITIISNIFL